MDEDRKLRITTEWADHLEELRHVSERIHAYLQVVCASLVFEAYANDGLDFRLRFVDRLRIKEPVSIIRKLEARPKLRSIWDIDDLIGMRVVVVSPSDVDKLTRAIISDDSCPLKG